MKLKNCWTADFETTTDENDCRVWAYSMSNIEDQTFIWGTSIDEFFERIINSKDNLKIWFHNLKFDGIYLMNYLFLNDYQWVESKEEISDNTFTTLITDMGQFYSITVYFKKMNKRYHKVEFFDSMKILNFSVENVAEGFNPPIRKLKIDYKKYRPIGYQLDEDEIAYIRNDVEIMSLALKFMFEKGMNKMTIASDAMTDFKKRMVGFRKKFPVLPKEVDKDIRVAYKGGFTYANPKWIEKPVKNVTILDVNSLYPSCLVNYPMPFSVPQFFEGEYKYDPVYPLYVQSITCRFEIKPNKIPSIQIKRHIHFDFNPTEYVTSSKGEKVTLYLTKPDMELFKEQYNIYSPSYGGGWKFMSATGMFDNYINYWTEQKIKAGKEGNAQQRMLAKLCLNSIYGRFGLSPIARQKRPYMNDNGVVKFVQLPAKEREPVYVPVAAFTTAYGRKRTIETSQIIRDFTMKKYGEDRWYYGDTDSCHASLTDEDLEELKDIIQIDDYKLGYWAKEGFATRAMFIRAKCYIEEVDGKLYPTVSGLPKHLAPLITFENFKKGFSTSGLSIEEMVKLASKNGASEDEIEKLHHKLTYKYVQGGVILADTDFTIK